MFAVICADGRDRLKAHWEREVDARFDAAYFSRRTYCGDWSRDHSCPGGTHTVEPIDYDGFAFDAS